MPGTKVYLRDKRLTVDRILCAIIQNNPKAKATNLFKFNKQRKEKKIEITEKIM